MARWIILLRGVNVSGKNKVPMAEWKAGLAALGYTNIVTLQNSGNAVLDTNSDQAALIHEVTDLMRERFGLEIPVYAIEQESLRELLAQSPAWWATKIKRFMTILSFCCRPIPRRNWRRHWARRTRSWSGCTPAGTRCFGALTGRNTRKPTGGPGPRRSLPGSGSRYGQPVLCASWQRCNGFSP